MAVARNRNINLFQICSGSTSLCIFHLVASFLTTTNYAFQSFHILFHVVHYMGVRTLMTHQSCGKLTPAFDNFLNIFVFIYDHFIFPLSSFNWHILLLSINMWRIESMTEEYKCIVHLTYRGQWSVVRNTNVTHLILWMFLSQDILYFTFY